MSGGRRGITDVKCLTSRDTVVRVVTKPRAGQSKRLCFIPRKRCLPSPKRPRCLFIRFGGYRGYFPGGKVTRREAGYSLPASSEVKNEWRYTSTPSIFLRVVHKDRCTFTRTFAKYSCLHVAVQNVWDD